MAIIDELLVGLGFEYDPSELKQFNDDVGKTVNIVKSLTKVAIAGAAAITALTISSTRASDEQGKLADEIGDTVENIDALQFASQRTGGSADGMANSLRNLAIRASEASRGIGSGVEAFGLLGISSTDLNGNLKSTSVLMLEIAKEFEELDSAKQIELADKLGVRDSIRLLQQSRYSITDLISEAKLLGVTTKEDAFLAAEFQDSLTDIWQITKQVSRTLSRIFAPALQEMNNQFVDWWKANRKIIEQKLPEWVDKFTMALKLLTIALGGFLAFRFASHLLALITLMKGLTVATLATNVAMFLLPSLIALTGLAFVALVEDAKVFFEGGESFIGDMLEKYPKWETELRGIASIFNEIAIVVGVIRDSWNATINLIKGEAIVTPTGGLSDKIPGSENLPFFDYIIKGGKDIRSYFGLENRTLSNSGGGNIPELGTPISNRSSSTSVDKVEIIIQGGNDNAENIANAVLDVFQQTSQDLNSTVDQ